LQAQAIHEQSGLRRKAQEEKIKKFVVGKAPKNGQAIIQLDDVFTTGDAKYDAIKELKSLGDFKLPLLAIAVDRQEVGIDGKSAIKEYEEKTGIKVVSVINALDVIKYLSNCLEKDKGIYNYGPIMNQDQLKKSIRSVSNYLHVYGTEEAKKEITAKIGKLEQRIISYDKSIIPACDVPTLEEFENLVKETSEIEKIGGYKIGFELSLGYGLEKVVETARKHTSKPIIYDHQKAGIDIPETGKNFARVCKKAGIDTVILFPQAGPETERAWIYHSLNEGLNVIVGGRMTHPAYSQSEGGFISDEGALEMYRIAARAGINNFVVPGNKPEVIKKVREIVEAEGIDPVFYAPGFVSQGGKIEEAAKVAGEKWHAIVGRGIYQAHDKKEAALEHTSQL